MSDARIALPILLIMVPAMTFAMVGALMWVLAAITGWSRLVVVLAAIASSALSFLWFVNLVVNRLYPVSDDDDIEFPATATDATAEVATHAATRVALVLDDDYPRGHYETLPVEPEKLYKFAQGILDGRGFAEAEWIGKRGLFSKSEYAALRSSLLARGVIRWVNEDAHAQGVEVTKGGVAFFRAIVSENDADKIPPPLASGNNYVS